MNKQTSGHRHSRNPRAPRRRNLLEEQEEYWRPPLFQKENAGLASRLKAPVRRFFDLQAGSVWKDLSQLLQDARGSVLDIGCGAQPYRALFPGGVKYLGIDTEDAKKRFGYDVPDTIYFGGGRFPVESGSIDFVLCSEVLEHIPDIETFFHEVTRCLRPGGSMVLTVPFSARWHFIPYDYWRFTPSGLKNILTKAGFTNIAVFARGNQLTVACYKQMAVVLSLLLAKNKGALSILSRLAGIICLPVFFLLALVANVTMGIDWGDDCLGYTATATLPETGARGGQEDS